MKPRRKVSIHRRLAGRSLLFLFGLLVELEDERARARLGIRDRPDLEIPGRSP